MVRAVNEDLVSAAARIRAMATAATQGRWDASVLGSEGYDVRGVNPDSPIRRIRVGRCGYEKWETDKGNAEHIALWDPEVARAVAGLLDVVVADCGTSTLVHHAAREVARLLLDEEG